MTYIQIRSDYTDVRPAESKCHSRLGVGGKYSLSRSPDWKCHARWGFIRSTRENSHNDKLAHPANGECRYRLSAPKDPRDHSTTPACRQLLSYRSPRLKKTSTSE